jgi:hypothetical protein
MLDKIDPTVFVLWQRICILARKADGKWRKLRSETTGSGRIGGKREIQRLYFDAESWKRTGGVCVLVVCQIGERDRLWKGAVLTCGPSVVSLPRILVTRQVPSASVPVVSTCEGGTSLFLIPS